MNLRDKILNPSVPVTLFEIVPPAQGKPEALEATVEEVRKVRHLVDAINLPEIRDESRGTERTSRFIERVEPRFLGARLQKDLSAEVVINRVVVHDPQPAQWFRETSERYGIQHMVLVGGESAEIQYPGPSPTEAAELVQSAGLPISLGGITIPSRPNEADRIRSKNAAGMSFFTSQILFDSNDIVWLIQRLNGVEARIFLSFAPVSHPRDLEFLRWLGADIPQDLDRFLLQEIPQITVRSEPSFLYALMYASVNYLSGLTPAKVKGNVAETAVRLLSTYSVHPEYQTTFIKLLVSRKAKMLDALREVPEFKEIAPKIADMMAAATEPAS